MVKSCFGASGAGAASTAAAVEGAAAASAAGGAPTFRSVVVDGSMSTFWFGTASGFATAP